jgi:protein-S-isoprenylcysteine O-methyltransferase Ste14
MLPHLTLWQIDLLPWYAFFVVWAVGALKVKQTKMMEPDAARLFTGILMVVAYLLLFSHYFEFGVLARRMFPSISSVEWFGVVLTYAGATIAIWARLILGQNWSARVTLKVGHELIHSGPYGYVRHPIYTGMLLAMAGTAIVVGEWKGAAAVVLSIVTFCLKAQREEQFMVTEFGERYQEYRSQTGFLVPGL